MDRFKGVIYQADKSSLHPCDYCDLMFTTKKSLKQHRERDHFTITSISHNVFQCKHCKRQFISQDSLDKHTTHDHHFLCEICNNASSSLKGLIEHMFKEHCVTYMCEVCKQVFVKKELFENHKMSCLSPSSQIPPQQLSKPCEICGSTYINNKLLVQHLFEEHSLKYYCEICVTFFTSSQYLNLHNAEKHYEGKDVMCDFFNCIEVFRTKDAMQRHLKRDHHVQTARFKCTFPQCEATFESQNLLDTHTLERHTYQCDICDKFLNSRDLLNEHFQKHSNQTTFKHKCEHCENFFENKKDLQYHQSQKHSVTGVTFECGFCDDKFSSQELCDEHISSKHMLECSKCHTIFQYQNDLDQHIETQHEPEEPLDTTPPSRRQPPRSAKGKAKYVFEMDDSETGSESDVVEDPKEKNNQESDYEVSTFTDWNDDDGSGSEEEPRKPIQNERKYTETKDLKETNDTPKPFKFLQLKRKDMDDTPEPFKSPQLKKKDNGASKTFKMQQIDSEEEITAPTLMASLQLIKNHKNTKTDEKISAPKQYSPKIFTNNEVKRSPTKFICSVCNGAYLGVAALKEHYRLSHPESTLKIEYKKKKTLGKLNIKLLKDSSGDEAGGSLAQYYMDFFAEEVSEKQMMKESGKQHECLICNERFLSNNSLEHHFQSMHSGVSKTEHKCETCGLIFKSRKTLASHSRIHKPKQEKEKKRFYKCKLCKENFCNASAFSQHCKEFIPNLNVHSCDKCPKIFHFREKFEDHLKTHDMPDAVLCKFCGEGFPDKTFLAQHYREFYPNFSLFRCSVCSKVFHLQKKLELHMEIHKSERPPDQYTCHICSEIMYGTEALQNHYTEKHPSRRPKFEFSCEKCGRVFRVKKELEQHQQMLKGFGFCEPHELKSGYEINVLGANKAEKTPRSFACKFCKETFPDGNVLAEHYKEFFPNLTLFSCDKCPKIFHFKARLLVHMKTHGINKEKHKLEKNKVNEKCLKQSSSNIDEECIEIDDSNDGMETSTTNNDFENTEILENNSNEVMETDYCEPENNRSDDEISLLEVEEEPEDSLEYDIELTMLECSKCPPDVTQVFTSIEDLEAHKKMHENDDLIDDSSSMQPEEYKCDACSEIFESFLELESHGLDSHGFLIEEEWVTATNEMEV